MSDRGFLFLFSVVMIVVSLGSAGWLFATHQADTVDGLFLLLTALLVALCFALYILYAIHRAMEAAAQAAAPQTAKPAVAPAAKRTPAPAAQA